MKKTYIFLSLGCLLISVILICGCAAPSKCLVQNNSGKPEWVMNHPNSPDYFIGIACSPVTGGNLGDAQEKSRFGALQDIAQQIELQISSDKRLTESHSQANGAYQDVSIYQKQIKTLAQAVLAGWEVRRTWQDPAGYYWTEVVLDKQAYYAKVNKRFNDAIGVAVDAINAAKSGHFTDRLQQLLRGLSVIDSFPAGSLRGIIDGKEAILSEEIPARIRGTLSGVEVRPNVNNLKVGASSPVPDTLGVSFLIDGIPDMSTKVIWTSSSNAVSLQDLPIRADGLHPVIIKPLPASAGVVTITAQPDPGNIRYELLKRGFVMATGSFTISRSKPVVAAPKDKFSTEVFGQLLSHGAIVQARPGEKNDYTIDCGFIPESETTITMGLFKARGTLTVRMTGTSSEALIDYTGTIGAASSGSPQQAVGNLHTIAVDEAVKRIEGAL